MIPKKFERYFAEFLKSQIARMCVTKMVENGFDSALAFREELLVIKGMDTYAA